MAWKGKPRREEPRLALVIGVNQLLLLTSHLQAPLDPGVQWWYKGLLNRLFTGARLVRVSLKGNVPCVIKN